MGLDRRQFVRYFVTGPVLAGCPLTAEARAPTQSVEGESFAICHRLRDGEAFPSPRSKRRHDVVIVGGGIGGLTAAYLLRDRDVLILEKEPEWGGNARLDTQGGQAYSVGSAFIGMNDSAARFSRELGLQPLPIDNWDGTMLAGRFTPDTWGDGLDELPYRQSVRTRFRALRRDLLAIDLKQEADRYDNLPFVQVVEAYGPEAVTWWDGYSRSTYGGSSREIPASLGIGELQFMARPNRRDSRATWPGGIGALSQRLAERVRARLGERMIGGATVVSIQSRADRAEVTWLDAEGVQAVEAKAVVLAAPQYIASRLVANLPADQVRAMQSIRHAPYAVVNLLFNEAVFRGGYDTWCPGNRFTDVVVADWVTRNSPRKPGASNILTCYAPLRADERETLLSEEQCLRLAAGVLADFQVAMPGLDVEPFEVHLFRRGHAMHVSTVGLEKLQAVARRPFGRVAFAAGDVEGLEAATGTAIRAAHRAVGEVEKHL